MRHPIQCIEKIKLTSSNPILATLESQLVAIEVKYLRYRHNIFAHNNVLRPDYIEQFNQAGISWESIDNDCIFLDCIWKIICFTLEGIPIPPETELQQLYLPSDSSRLGVIAYTKIMLDNFSKKE